jgi:4-hydroxybenzoyl-CoA reductase subunit beta
MLRLPRFEHYAPKSISQAVKMRSELGPEALFVAGGTDVLPKMKRFQFQPKALISLRQIKRLSGIQGSRPKGYVIKAGTTLAEVASHAGITKVYPGLARAAGLVSTPILRHMGTIGGNLCLDTRCNYYDQTQHWRKSVGWCLKAPGPQGVLFNATAPHDHGVPCRVAPGGDRCWAVSSTDTAPVMVALGAQLVLVSARGERLISAKDLYRDDGMQYLSKQHDELLTEIQLPPPDGLQTTYWKLRRRGAFDFPVLGVAVALKRDEGETITHCRIVLGGIASYPVEFTQAAQLLIGQKPTLALIEQAAQAVFGPARPMDNTDYHLYYRKRMAPVYVRRALWELTQ